MDEATEIGRLLGCEPLIGVDASKAAVMERLEGASIIHLATHGVVDGLGARLLLHGSGASMDRSLKGDGGGGQWLWKEDLTGVADDSRQLQAQLAVLSACNSGQAQVMTGEGVVGLARALMACGVPTVVVALWPLP